MYPRSVYSGVLIGTQMISEIEIRNYKCFEHLKISDCRRVNVIVGDNGAGKTALLEGIFMALGATSELVLRFRQLRGLDGSFRGGSRKIEEALWRDYFYKLDMNRPISITLSGSGNEARSVLIDRGQQELFVPLKEEQQASINSVIKFQWKDNMGRTWHAVPEISTTAIKFPDTGEDLPDFFFLPANQTVLSSENADRFSDLSRVKRKQFTDMLTQEYSWIKELSVESKVGAPAIYASVDGLDEPLPITSVSGGINRMIAILLAIASRERSVILIDEAENDVFHSHQKGFWRAILQFTREYNSQVFLTTHSEEWLESLAAVIDSSRDDVALWRAERVSGVPVIRQFTGRQVPIGIQMGEVR